MTINTIIIGIIIAVIVAVLSQKIIDYWNTKDTDPLRSAAGTIR